MLGGLLAFCVGLVFTPPGFNILLQCVTYLALLGNRKAIRVPDAARAALARGSLIGAAHRLSCACDQTIAREPDGLGIKRRRRAISLRRASPGT